MDSHRQSYITVVSGLPRSGTSLMMQVLEAGGMPILCDGIRRADIHNPCGYYEYEKVKTLARDRSWIGDAEGKVVKIVSMHLYNLPPDHCYRVIFMTRRMDEILTSQSVMLDKLGKKNGPDDAQMARHYEKHLVKLKEWLDQQKHIKVMYCSYQSLFKDPSAALTTVRNFLGGTLNAERMGSVIDPGLYRERTGDHG